MPGSTSRANRWTFRWHLHLKPQTDCEVCEGHINTANLCKALRDACELNGSVVTIFLIGRRLVTVSSRSGCAHRALETVRLWCFFNHDHKRPWLFWCKQIWFHIITAYSTFVSVDLTWDKHLCTVESSECLQEWNFLVYSHKRYRLWSGCLTSWREQPGTQHGTATTSPIVWKLIPEFHSAFLCCRVLTIVLNFRGTAFLNAWLKKFVFLIKSSSTDCVTNCTFFSRRIVRRSPWIIV